LTGINNKQSNDYDFDEFVIKQKNAPTRKNKGSKNVFINSLEKKNSLLWTRLPLATIWLLINRFLRFSTKNSFYFSLVICQI